LRANSERKGSLRGHRGQNRWCRRMVYGRKGTDGRPEIGESIRIQFRCFCVGRTAICPYESKKTFVVYIETYISIAESPSGYITSRDRRVRVRKTLSVILPVRIC
jgi:hypothetical protein